MGGVLFRYLSTMLLKRTFATLLVLVGLLQVVDLFDASSEVLKRGLGMGGILEYEFLRTPVMIEQILPVAVLVGALTCFTGLARNSEMAALRATGATIYRIVALMLPAAALVAVLHFLIADQVSPRAQQAFTVWWNSHPPKTQAVATKIKPVWFRTGSYLVYAEGASADGRRLEKPRIYRREPGGRMSERLLARSAAFGVDGRWTLDGVQELDVAPTSLNNARQGQRVWNADLDPADVVTVFSPEERISAGKALRAMTGNRPADKSPAYYATRIQRALAEPLGALVMLLLAAPAALAHQRNSQATLLMFSLAAGLMFLAVDGVLTALGQTNVLPPLLAAWAGPALFAALAGAALVHLEG
ncbi:MAG TPA: LptF/LptG family permease [Caulobacteraceae bacterium]|jgi:lipopolysaccharide export system permease protein|nr:LptF/LptG family permease [Caulobacteraceae bacterium]